MNKERKQLVNPYDEHERLFSGTGLKLGKTLWYMLNAAQEIERRTYIVQPNGKVSRELTKFRKEVGKDEIYWWIYKKESDVEELQIKVKQTLLSLQNLKESANKLEFYGIQTYADLVTVLANFTEARKAQIDDLHEFAVWLHRKDPLCPAILFTYRVWGSTRIADRWLELDTPNLGDESVEVIRRLTEIAYGLFQRFSYTRFSVTMDIGAEMYDSDPENYRPQEIPENRVISRTANKVLKEFAVFFEELRDSLRNIELDIEKHLAEKNLLKSESFWRNFIIKLKTPGRLESIWKPS